MKRKSTLISVVVLSIVAVVEGIAICVTLSDPNEPDVQVSSTIQPDSTVAIETSVDEPDINDVQPESCEASDYTANTSYSADSELYAATVTSISEESEPIEYELIVPFEEQSSEIIIPGGDVRAEEEIGSAVWYNPETGMYESSDGDTWPELDEIGSAVRYNPETGMYESSDGQTWPADEDYIELNNAAAEEAEPVEDPSLTE